MRNKGKNFTLPESFLHLRFLMCWDHHRKLDFEYIYVRSQEDRIRVSEREELSIRSMKAGKVRKRSVSKSETRTILTHESRIVERNPNIRSTFWYNFLLVSSSSSLYGTVLEVVSILGSFFPWEWVWVTNKGCVFLLRKVVLFTLHNFLQFHSYWFDFSLHF